MPLLVYVFVASTALVIGLFTIPDMIGPVEPSAHIRFGMPAGHVPTTTAEMIAQARQGAEAVRRASASRDAEAAVQTPIAAVPAPSLSSPARAKSAKAAKPNRRANSGDAIARSLPSDRRTAQSPALAFNSRNEDQARFRHGDLQSF